MTKILVAILPVVIVVLVAKEKIETLFYRPKLIAFFFFVTAFYLLLSKKYGKKNINSYKKNDNLLSDFFFHHALIIGISQMIAILPGISRSGMTITTALLLGFSSQRAMFFSFLIAIPIISGAAFLEILKYTVSNKK